MTQALPSIMTRTGDRGTTALANGSRISKQDIRMEAIGDVDELNAMLGLILCESLPATMQTALLQIQRQLFLVGASLALSPQADFDASYVKELELLAIRDDASLPQLRHFILPGGSRAAALLHVARTICRRAERHLFRLEENTFSINDLCAYMNRLSDLLFIWARLVNQLSGQAESFWTKEV